MSARIKGASAAPAAAPAEEAATPVYDVTLFEAVKVAYECNQRHPDARPARLYDFELRTLRRAVDVQAFAVNMLRAHACNKCGDNDETLNTVDEELMYSMIELGRDAVDRIVDRFEDEDLKACAAARQTGDGA